MEEATNSSKSNFLSISSKTWTRDSHGLFDYESTTVKENLLIIEKECVLIRKKHEVKEKVNSKEGEIFDESLDQYICNIEISNGK